MFPADTDPGGPSSQTEPVRDRGVCGELGQNLSDCSQCHTGCQQCQDYLWEGKYCFLRVSIEFWSEVKRTTAHFYKHRGFICFPSCTFLASSFSDGGAQCSLQTSIIENQVKSLFPLLKFPPFPVEVLMV